MMSVINSLLTLLFLMTYKFVTVVVIVSLDYYRADASTADASFSPQENLSWYSVLNISHK